MKLSKVFLLLLPATLFGEAPNYQDNVLPILKKHCNGCHNADKKKAGLDLSSYTAAQLGSSGGEVIKIGLPDTSPLVLSIEHDEDYEPMPPKKPKIPDADIQIIRQWIAGGLLEAKGGKSKLREITFDVSSGSSARPDVPAFPKNLPIANLPITKFRSPIYALASSPWADVIAAAGQERINLYGSSENNGDHKFLGALPFPEGTIHDIRFSPNGKMLIVAGGKGAHSGYVVLYDVETGSRLARIGNESDSILSADISPNHEKIAIGTTTKKLKIFSTKDGKLLHTVDKHLDWVTAVRFSPNGKYLASADRNGGIHVREADTAGIVFELVEHKVRVTSLAWRPDSKMLASGAEDGKFVLWDMKDGWATRANPAHKQKAHTRYSRRTGIMDVAFTKDGNLITIGRDRSLMWWKPDGTSAGRIQDLSALPLQAAPRFEGNVVFTGDMSGNLIAWDLEKKKQVQNFLQASSN